MQKKRTEELRDWSYTKDRIGQQLRAHFEASTTEELPPRLVAVLKKMDTEAPED